VTIVDATGLYVTPGLVDLHAHVFFGTEPHAAYSNGYSALPPDGFTFRAAWMLGFHYKEDNFRPASAVSSNYDVSGDGERFLMIRPTGEPPREIRVIVNWLQELERLVPKNE